MRINYTVMKGSWDLLRVRSVYGYKDRFLSIISHFIYIVNVCVPTLTFTKETILLDILA